MKYREIYAPVGCYIKLIARFSFTIHHKSLTAMRKTPFQNIIGQEVIKVSNILPFPCKFSTLPNTNSIFEQFSKAFNFHIFTIFEGAIDKEVAKDFK